MRLSLYFLLCFMGLLLMWDGVPAKAAEDGTIKGKITTSSGKPMAGGWVYLFNVKGPSPFTSAYWREKDYSVQLNNDGSFSGKVPEGKYYLMAVHKADGNKTGPPEVGDLVFPPLDGRDPRVYVIRANEITDIGTLTEAVVFRKEWALTGSTGIEGVIFDGKGTPVEGKLVMAFGTAAMESPVFVSDRRTNQKGEYILRVPVGGRYFVRVKGHREPVTEVEVKTGEFTKGPDIIIKTFGQERN